MSVEKSRIVRKKKVKGKKLGASVLVFFFFSSKGRGVCFVKIKEEATVFFVFFKKKRLKRRR